MNRPVAVPCAVTGTVFVHGCNAKGIQSMTRIFTISYITRGQKWYFHSPKVSLVSM